LSDKIPVKILRKTNNINIITKTLLFKAYHRMEMDKLNEFKITE